MDKEFLAEDEGIGFDPEEETEIEISEADLTEPAKAPFLSEVDLSSIEFLSQPDEWVGVEKLRTMYHESNSQVRDPIELAAIQRSLKKNGMAGALIVINRWNGKLLSGHGKVEAAYQGGYRGDMPVVYRHIPSDMEHRLVMLQLNMAMGHQDEELQRREVKYLLDLLPFQEVLPDLAMTETELADLLNLASNAPEVEAPESFKEYGEDIETEYRCPKCSYSWSGKPS